MIRDVLKYAATAVVAAALAYGLFAVLGRPGGEAPLTAEQGQQILAELRQVREQLDALRNGGGGARQTADGRLRVPVKGRPSLGESGAPLTMVEFTDFQCPYCRRFHSETFPALKANYIDTGKLHYVLIDLPLRIHDQAVPAARAAHCAGEQDKYFAMVDQLFEHARGLNPDGMAELARAAGIDVSAFTECLASDRHRETVESGVELATRLGLTGTPSFVVGRLTEDGYVEGQKVVGALPYKVFEAGLNRLLGDE